MCLNLMTLFRQQRETLVEGTSETGSRAIVISEGRTATTDYFIIPHLVKEGYSIQVLDTRLLPPKKPIPDNFQLVIISRYLPKNWFDLLDEYRRKGGSVKYFMDDDLWDNSALKGLPWRYKRKIHRLVHASKKNIIEIIDGVWVSTGFLSEKYSKYNPRLILAAPSVDNVRSKQAVRICYHGTASHSKEIQWLLPIISKIQEMSKDTHFEIFGNQKINKQFRSLDRVSILHPMSWNNYFEYTSSVRCDIALAPMLDTPFNKGRGPTKFYDFIRMGAIGVYSNVEPYNNFVTDGVDGVILENIPELWIDTILELVSDSEKRKNISQAAQLNEIGK